MASVGQRITNAIPDLGVLSASGSGWPFARRNDTHPPPQGAITIIGTMIRFRDVLRRATQNQLNRRGRRSHETGSPPAGHAAPTADHGAVMPLSRSARHRTTAGAAVFLLPAFGCSGTPPK